MTETLSITRLRGSTILKLTVMGTSIGFCVLCMALSIFAAFGVEILAWNGAYVTGPVALIAGPLIGLFIGVIFGALAGIASYVGLRIYARFKPLQINYVPLKAGEH